MQKDKKNECYEMVILHILIYRYQHIIASLVFTNNLIRWKDCQLKQIVADIYSELRLFTMTVALGVSYSLPINLQIFNFQLQMYCYLLLFQISIVSHNYLYKKMFSSVHTNPCSKSCSWLSVLLRMTVHSEYVRNMYRPFWKIN
jgi:hypothetical protein